MSIESDIFNRYSPDFKKLKDLGFKRNKNGLEMEIPFPDRSFRAKININNSGEVLGTVIDNESNEPFLPLRILDNQGSYVAEVRAEFEKILYEIRDKGFNQNYFISAQANRIAKTIYDNYNDEPVFMWEKYPTFGVYKNPKTDKWYGLIMHIERSKLGEKSKDFVEVMNLKLNHENIPDLIKKDGIYPAYHMNKKYWISVTLDDTLSDEEIVKFIDQSHKYTVK